MDTAAPDLAQALTQLARVAGRLPQGETFLPAALDALAAIVPYDLAVVLRLEGEHLKVVCARGPLAGDRVRAHQLALDRFPSIREALRTGNTRIMVEADHARGDGDPYDGILDLPHGHACMVVPLLAGGQILGALTFDRNVCSPFDPLTVNLATIYGQLIALSWMASDQGSRMQRQRERLEAENRLLRSEVVGADDAGALMERTLSPALQRLLRQARQVAPSESAVLITGETGTGKEVLARAIHGWSRRADQPFLKLNCAALPEHLVESELFGHVRGAFSGATQARPGRFQVADQGTLLLDEIGDLPLAAQAKLLRVLQEGVFEPVGSDRSVAVDVRIMASTNVNLEQAVALGRFRTDLYYRLNVFPLHLPALRERPEDIVLLAEDWLYRQAKRTGQGPWRLAPEDGDALKAHTWPGNLRELVNVLERATILSGAGELRVGPLTGPPAKARPPLAPSEEEGDGDLDTVQRNAILKALQQCGGRIYGEGGAAVRLGMKPTTLQSRIKKLGISKVSRFD